MTKKRRCNDPDCEGVARCPCCKPEYWDRVEREELQAEQTRKVMPCIGPLLDAWDGLPNDLVASLCIDAPDLTNWMLKIQQAIYDET